MQLGTNHFVLTAMTPLNKDNLFQDNFFGNQSSHYKEKSLHHDFGNDLLQWIGLLLLQIICRLHNTYWHHCIAYFTTCAVNQSSTLPSTTDCMLCVAYWVTCMVIHWSMERSSACARCLWHKSRLTKCIGAVWICCPLECTCWANAWLLRWSCFSRPQST